MDKSIGPILKPTVPMRLDLVAKLTYQSNTKIVSVGIKYSVRDLLFDVNNLLCLTRKLAICGHIR